MRLDVDLKVDYAFKKVFGSEANRDVLIDLLHAVLQPKPGRLITELELLNPFSEQDTLTDKLAVLDVKARDQSMRQFHVEMQMRVEWFFPGRASYYWAKFHQQQLQEGDYYQTLRPTISIWFVNEPVVAQVAEPLLVFRLWDVAHQVGLTDDLAIHILQLPHFTKGLDQLETALDRWCWLLRHGPGVDPDQLPAALEVPAIRRAVEVLRMLKQSDVERERYEARLKAERDRVSSLLAAEQRGEERGEQRGEERGAQRELIHRVHLCQDLLKRPRTAAESLQGLPLADLKALADQLEADLRGT